MKTKLAFFDVEGTLFKKAERNPQGNVAPSAWMLLAKHLGKKATAEQLLTRKKWNRNEYNGYVEWMEDTIRIYQKYGLKKKFFDKVIYSCEYQPGVREAFLEIRKEYKTALISGGFKALADRAIVSLKIDHAFTACELFWDTRGGLAHWNLLPCDYEGKLEFMKLIMEEHGVKPKDCVFVGDGRNDIPLAKAVGTSICFNGDSELAKVCTYSIKQPASKVDFGAVLRYLK